MLKTLIIISIFYFIANYIIKNLRHLRTGEPNENNTNYWMFTYDFKETKKARFLTGLQQKFLKREKLKIN